MGGFGAVDLAFEAVLYKRREVPGMVNMCMGKDNCINSGRVYRKLRPVSSAQGFHALVHATIHEQAVVVVGKQIAGAGDGACTTEEAEFHRRVSPCLVGDRQSLTQKPWVSEGQCPVIFAAPGPNNAGFTFF